MQQQLENNFKEMPNNDKAEQQLLGALLNNNEHMHKVADFLLAEHFYVPIHRKVFQAITKLIERGMIASPITLKGYFAQDEVFKDSGTDSFDYLVKLAANAATTQNIETFAKSIYECAIRRSLIEIGEQVLQESYVESPDMEPQQRIEKVEQSLFNLASQGTGDNAIVDLGNSITQALNRIELSRKAGKGVNGVATKFLELDKLTGGLQPSDLLILAARPSMGKTALAVNIAVNAVESFLEEHAKLKKEGEKPKSVGIFSLEMSAEQIATRILSIKTGVDGSKIRIGNVSKDEFILLSNESSKLSQLPLFIDDTPALSISAIRTRARRMKRQFNIGMLLVDYLQLIKATGTKEGNRVQEIGEISQGLKAIAKELDIPVIALSQLSRAVESRDDKRPLLSDLRESGNIEQDADVVMFIYREEYYLTRKMPVSDEDKLLSWQTQLDKVKNIAEIIIAKQRNGPVGSLSLHFNNATTGFSNLDTQH